MKYLILVPLLFVLMAPLSAFAADCGDVLKDNNNVEAVYNGIAAYHNGNCMGGGCQCGSTGSHGGHWYCVEYARRYYCDALHIPDASNWGGDAGTWFDHAGQRGLIAYQNDYTAEPPKADDILCYSGGGYGHVGIVKGVTDNGNGNYTVHTIEQNWSTTGLDDRPMVKTSTQSGMGHFYMSPRGDYSIQGWLRFPWDLIQNEYNNNGGSSAFGTLYLQFTTSGTNYVHFYHGGYYSNSSNDCVIHNFSSGSYGNCGIVYDAFDGARRAYTVRTGFWNDGYSHGWAYLTGPASSLGMPITDEYATNYGARQDFTMGYLTYTSSNPASSRVSTPQSYPHTAPGWHENNGWDARFSYLFAMAYERNGAWTNLGNPSEAIDLSWNGTAYHVQHFGSDKMIVYDPYNSVGNSMSTDEAYYLYGDFYTYWTSQPDVGPWVLGAPTTDRVGNTQYFKYGRMVDDGIIRAYNLSNQEIWNNEVGASGGLAPLSGDHFVAFTGKFNGDQYVDAGLWDTLTGNWYIADRDPNSNCFIPRDGPVLQGWGSGGGYKLIVKDFSGDGYDDLCLYYYALGRWFVAYNGGTYFDQVDGPHTYGAWLDSWATGDADDWIPFSGQYSVDGNNDVGVLNPASGRWFVVHNWNTHTPPEFIQQAGPSPNPWWLDNWGTGSYGSYWPFSGYLVGGDSYEDVGVLHPGTGRLFVAAYNDNPYRFVSNGLWLDAFPSAGGTSAWRVYSGKSSAGSYDDVIVHLPAYGRWYVAWNWGTYFAKATGTATDGSWLDGWATEDGELRWQTFTGDVNGDQNVDLIAFTPLYGRWFVALNNHGSTNFTNAAGTDDGAWLNNWGVQTGGSPKVVGTGNEQTLPEHFSLSQNYPNPFNPATIISYSLPEATHVTLDIFNILGQKVARLVDAYHAAGTYTATWNSDSYSSGIYLYRLTTGAATETKKMVLLK